MRVWTVLCVVLLAATLSRGDIVMMLDGTKLEGKIQKTGDGWTVTKADGTTVTVDADQVATIEASRSADPVSVGEDRLASLRRVSEHLTDLQDIISRYQRFVADLGDQKVLAEAQKDLKIWQDRQSQGMVKLGDQWVSADERERRRSLAQSEALPAKDLIASYKYKDADKILQQAVLDDPECATAWYLQGVALYKQEQVQGAKKAFETVNQIVPQHAPTLNNLAVIAWRQRSFVIAMNYYDQAMVAAPLAKEVLDNVAEALNVVPSENSQAPVVLQGVKLFAEQDTELQKVAAQQGMFRWGATWVDGKQLQELKADEARVKQKLDAIQAQFDAIQQKVAGLNSESDQNLREMNRLQAQSTYMDRYGNTVQMPLPDTYYQLKNDNDNLAQQKQPLLAQQQDLKNKAKDVQAEIPVPKFTGIQQIIGVDGTPLRGMEDSGPATMPSQAN